MSDADLLNPQSWTKRSEPILLGGGGEDADSLYGCSNISVTPTADGDGHWLFYESMKTDADGVVHRDIRIRPLHWATDGMPDFCQTR